MKSADFKVKNHEELADMLVLAAENARNAGERELFSEAAVQASRNNLDIVDILMVYTEARGITEKQYILDTISSWISSSRKALVLENEIYQFAHGMGTALKKKAVIDDIESLLGLTAEEAGSIMLVNRSDARPVGYGDTVEEAREMAVGVLESDYETIVDADDDDYFEDEFVSCLATPMLRAELEDNFENVDFEFIGSIAYPGIRLAGLR